MNSSRTPSARAFFQHLTHGLHLKPKLNHPKTYPHFLQHRYLHQPKGPATPEPQSKQFGEDAGKVVYARLKQDWRWMLTAIVLTPWLPDPLDWWMDRRARKISKGAGGNSEERETLRRMIKEGQEQVVEAPGLGQHIEQGACCWWRLGDREPCIV